MREVFSRYFLFIFFSLSAPDVAHAQEAPPETNRVSVHFDNSNTQMLVEKYTGYNAGKDVADGYRIQITYTDVREDIYRNKAALYPQFPDLSSYVEYEQPYYKLRLGDFYNRLDATYYLQQVISVYPGAFIVKDKIKIK